MPRLKKEEEIRNPLAEAIKTIRKDNQLGDEAARGMIDIISFCESPYYLNLEEEFPQGLWIGQKVILKCFYMGTIGNEKLALTKEEWEWLYSKEIPEEIDGIVYDNNIKDVIKKIRNREQNPDAKIFKELQLVLGRRASKCRYENDLIATTVGSITFRELCDRHKKGDKIGIITYHPETLKKECTYDIKVADNGFVDCYLVKTKSGIKEISSWNHPYLVWRKEKPEFVNLKDLIKGDKIAVAKKTELFGNESIGEQKAAFLGHFQGNVEEWSFGQKNYERKIPDSIFRAPKNEVAIFLSHLFGRDGYVSASKDKMSGLIGISLSSETTIDGIRHLLLKFGVHCVVKKEHKHGKTFGWKLIIDKKEDLIVFFDEIGIFPKEEIVKNALENLNNQEEPIEDFVKNQTNFDVIWDVVDKITHEGVLPTVDLEVNPHHIIGGDILSHNTLMASLITVYEAYKLLVINDGKPHKYYNLPQDDEIAIINVALSQQQAGRLFGQVQSRIRNSPFFKGRVAKETTSEIRLYTDGDLEKKASGANLSVPGSILLLCGHSNPDTLAGYSAILILFDEIAFYDETGKVTGKYFYGRLKPSLSKFHKFDAGRIVQISSPNNKMGIFYETYEQAKEKDHIISFQLPSWSVNDDIDYNTDELQQDRDTNFELFAVEYGAQWSTGGTYGNYFEPGLVDRCVRGDMGPHKTPQPGINYYLHVDPANGGNNYAAVLVGKKRYTNHMGHKRCQVYLAGCWVWRPVAQMGLMFTEIDKDIIKICQQFRPVMVTYDDYHSKQSMERLQSHGIRTRKIAFNRNVKLKLYQNLTDLMTYVPQPEIILYDDGGESSLLLGELRALKKKQIQRGISIIPDKYGDIKTDDLADCLAGAANAANDGLRMSLPEPVTVYTSFR